MTDQTGWATGEIAVGALTHGQPFCAGVLLVRDGQLLCSLGVEGLPEPPGRFGWRVGGVGGGQEPGEDVWQCALREAREELGCDVRLVAAPLTYRHDADIDEVTTVRCTDGLAPFCLQRRRNADPTKPFRPDLPAGPHTYYGLFLAEFLAEPVADGELSPGDDAEVLLFMPLAHWPMLSAGPTLHEVLAIGARLVAAGEPDLTVGLYLPPDESLVTVAPLLAAHLRLERL